MTRAGTIGLLCALAAGAAGAAPPARLAAALEKLQADVAAARRDLNAQRRRLAQARAAERAKLAAAEQAGREAARRLAARRGALRRRRAELDRLRADAARLDQQTRDALAALRDARKQAGAFFERGDPAPALAAFDRRLESDAARGELPSLCEEFFRLCETEAAACARVETARGEALLRNGPRVRGRVLRVGRISACFVDDAGAHAGLLSRETGAALPVLVERGLTRRQRAAIRAAVAGRAADAPVDVSGGWALVRLQQQPSLWERLAAGGPVMIPIGLLAALGVLLALERLAFLLRVDQNAGPLLEGVASAVSAGRYEEAEALCRKARGPLGRLALAGLEHARGGGAHLEDVLEEAVLAELPTLERGLGGLSVIAAVAPLLGLLGTVSGMIDTFHTITVYGAGDARLLSGGISEALVTTWAGLIVAAPLLLAHAGLARRVRKIVAEMERVSIALATTLRASPPRPEAGP